MSKLLIVLVGASLYFGSDGLAFAQKAGGFPPPEVLQTNANVPNYGIIRLPIGTLRIDIDDEGLPFKLQNLNRRFSEARLTEFLVGYIDKSDHPITIIVNSSTKRLVEGEIEFSNFLSNLANKEKVLVVYLPQPTGLDPDAKLRKYAETFANDQTSNMKESLSVHIPDHPEQNSGRFSIGSEQIDMKDFEMKLRRQLATNRYGRLVISTGKAGDPHFEQLVAQIATENGIAVEKAPPRASFPPPLRK